METDVFKLKNERQQLKKNLREETNKREKLETEKQNLESEKKDLEKKNSKSKLKIKQITSENLSLLEQLKEKIKNEEKLEYDKKLLEESIENYKKKINSLEEEKDKLEQQIKKFKKLTEKLENENKNFELKMKEMQKKIEQLEKNDLDKKELEKRNRELLKKIENLEINNQNLDKQTRLLKKKSGTFEIEKSDLREIWKKEYSKIVDELKFENQYLTKQLNELKKQQQKSYSTILDSLESEKKTREYEKSVEKLKVKIDSLLENVSSIKEYKIAESIIKEQEIITNSNLIELKKEINEKKNNDGISSNKIENHSPELPINENKNFKKITTDISISNTIENKSNISSQTEISIQFDEELLKYSGSERAILWQFHPILNSTIWNDGKWIPKGIVVQMEKRPFDEGAIRKAYRIRDLSQPEKLFVAKISKSSSHHSRNIYENDVIMQIYCQSWAKKFNQENPPKKVNYVDGWLLEFIDKKPPLFAMMENYIIGEFKKYSNNHGLVQYNRNTPQAFSHFTYERSNHELVIVDIQGVDDNYTDPQIHTRDENGFGLGNLGKKGIVQFLVTHECNPICNYLKLPNSNPQSISSSTTMSNNPHNPMTKGTMPFPYDLTKELSLLNDDNFKILDPNYKANKNFNELKCIEHIKISKANSLCVSENYLFVGTNDCDIKVYEISTFEMKISLKGHIGGIEAICSNNEYLFSGSNDKDIRIWNLTTWKCVQIADDHNGDIRALILNENFLFSGSNDKTVRVWSLKDFKCLKVLMGHEKNVKALAIKGNFLFSGGNDNLIKVWDIKNFKCIFNLYGHTKWVKSLSICGKYLFSGSNDKSIKIWDITKLELIYSIHIHSNKINSILATPYCLISASDDDDIKIFEYKNMECTISLTNHKGSISSLCINDTYLFSSSYDGIRVWEFIK